MQYKYNILHRINRLPYKIGKKFKKEAPAMLGIAPSTFNKYIYLKEDDQCEIRATLLIQIADFFEVHPRELYTTPPKPLPISKEIEITNQIKIFDYA